MESVDIDEDALQVSDRPSRIDAKLEKHADAACDAAAGQTAMIETSKCAGREARGPSGAVAFDKASTSSEPGLGLDQKSAQPKRDPPRGTVGGTTEMRASRESEDVSAASAVSWSGTSVMSLKMRLIASTAHRVSLCCTLEVVGCVSWVLARQ
jgi:hypothetical protein